MSMMTSQIFRYMDSSKTQKANYIEKKTLFSVQIGKFINRTFKAVLRQVFLARVTFKVAFLNGLEKRTTSF